MALEVKDGIIFLAGIFTGAAGQYFATKFTEQRHKQEAERQKKKKFKDLHKIMPELFLEIAKDIRGDETNTIREFFVLPGDHLKPNSEKARFLYYEGTHNNLQEKIDILESNSYVVDVTISNVPIYRMHDEFVNLLLKFVK